uniref:Protein VAC14 homolog n=1 Tax=Plectus sambesii TaxID=2011161 RepID=A0A914W468_9BILA
METQYAPLTASTVRSLTDKLYEKRKAAALDIEKQVREFVSSNQSSQLERVLDVLNELARSQNPHTRKGGLIGLAAAAIALGKLTANYTPQLVLPVVDCFADADSRVRYYACEALYNIVKVTREAALVHFSVLFDTLCKLSADTDQNVRSGSELLDRLLKDIVMSTSSFQVAEFVVLLRERIYTKNSSVRRFLVSWLSSLSTVPEVNLLPYLAEILDGLLQILSDPSLMVRELCESVLGQFLERIKANPSQVDLGLMVNVLIFHAQSTDDLVRFTALVWLQEFLTIGGVKMLPFASGYMTALLPCLNYPADEHRRDMHSVATATNVALMRLVDDDVAQKETSLELDSVIDVLKSHLQHETVQTRVAVLKWIHHLHKKMPGKVFPYVERLFPILLTMLSDASDEVVLLDLEVLSDLCQEKDSAAHVSLDALDLPTESKVKLAGISPYFVKFALSLLEMFRDDSMLLKERGTLIIRQLCLLLKPEEIYRSLAVLLSSDRDIVFVSHMVQTLNGILLTATELFPLRNQLKQLDSQASRDLFVCLYRCWCHQPVAVVGLCLLSQNYAHAAQLIHLFTDMDVTVDFLTEIDRLVQLLESPIFAYLRLHLLDSQHQNHLAAVLYGFLMLLPQTEAFHTLHRRLQCLPVPAATNVMSEKRSKSPTKAKFEGIAFDSLLQHFQAVQETHRHFNRLKHRELLAKTA